MRKCSCRSGLRRQLLKVTLDITAVLAMLTLPAKALWSQPVHPIEVTPITPEVAIYVPPDRTCTEEKLREVRGAGFDEVLIDCHLTLEPDDLITKRLVFEGAASSGVTLDCNGATIDGRPCSGGSCERVQVRSERLGTETSPTWQAVTDVTIENCNIMGALRIWGMGANGEAEYVRASSRYDADHVNRVRSAAPRRITLRKLKITGLGTRTPLYLAPGVSHVTLSYSEITGEAESVGVYLDAESYRNVLHDNYFHVTSRRDRIIYTQKREEIALDGSSYNTIMNNRFSSLEGGGIYLYRNCGYKGTVRHSTPRSNTIMNNVFYYNTYDGDNPAVRLGKPTPWWKVTCDDDDGFPWGSSVNDNSFARYNTIQQNQTYRTKHFVSQGDSTSEPNYIGNNEVVSADSRMTQWTHFATGSGFEYRSSFQRMGPTWQGRRLLVGDVDGDGRSDLVSVYGSSEGRARVWVQRSTESGFGLPTAYQTLARFSDTQRWLIGDFNGDDKDDLVNVYRDAAGRARVALHLSTESGFEYRTNVQRMAGFSTAQRWLAGDFNGDGRDDLVNVYGNAAGQARAWVHLSTGSGFEYQSSFQTFAGFWSTQRWLVGDFNGDGADDLVNVYGATGRARAWLHLSTGASFEYRSGLQTLAGFSTSQQWLVGDFDADGADDLVNVYGSSGRARAWVHLSTGSGFEYQSNFQTLAGFTVAQQWSLGDFNLDGRGDLINVYGARW